MGSSRNKAWFCETLRSVMAAHKVKTHDLGKVTGIPYQRLSNIVAGRTIPSLYEAEKLLEELGYELEVLRVR